MDQQKNSPSGHGPGNTRSIGVLPNWLDSRTIAILTTLLMVALALGAMMRTTYSRMGQEFGQFRQEFGQLRQEFGQLRQELRQEIGELRRDLSTDIKNVRVELTADIENLRDELGAEIKGLDTRLRTVEIDVAAIRERTSAVEGHTLDQDPWDTRSRDG